MWIKNKKQTKLFPSLHLFAVPHQLIILCESIKRQWLEGLLFKNKGNLEKNTISKIRPWIYLSSGAKKMGVIWLRRSRDMFILIDFNLWNAWTNHPHFLYHLQGKSVVLLYRNGHFFSGFPMFLNNSPTNYCVFIDSNGIYVETRLQTCAFLYYLDQSL